MKKYLFYCLMILLLSCNLSNTETRKKGLIVDISKEKIKLKPIHYSVSLIPLETNEECYLSYIYKAEVTSNYIFVLDRKTLYLFNKEGAFLKKICRGKGPGELTAPINMSVDRKRKEISVIEQGRFLHLYTFDLTHIKSYLLEGSFSNSCRIDEDNFYLHTALPGKYESHLISVFNKKKNKITRKLIGTKGLSLKELTLLTFQNFFRTEKDIYYSAPNNRTIYKYQNGNLEPVLKLNFKDLYPPNSFIKKYSEAGPFNIDSKKKNYISFIYYYYDFTKFSLVGLKYLDYNCGITYKNKCRKLYFTSYSELFDLPKTESFSMPISAYDKQIHFLYKNDILFNQENPCSASILRIKDQCIKIKENNNPIIITITIEEY